jgi:hypothetical protein
LGPVWDWNRQFRLRRTQHRKAIHPHPRQGNLPEFSGHPRKLYCGDSQLHLSR